MIKGKIKTALVVFILVFTIICEGSSIADAWYCPLCGRINEDNYCPHDGTKKPDGKYMSKADGSLSPDNKCVITPQFYSCERYKDRGQEFGQDLNKAFSDRTIRKQLEIGKRDFGLYLKFSPSFSDNGYRIRRIDFVITAPRGKDAYQMGCDTDYTCDNKYFVEWNFLSLMDLFKEQMDSNGSIYKGKYTIDIYFNEKWAGSTTFRVSD